MFNRSVIEEKPFSTAPKDLYPPQPPHALSGLSAPVPRGRKGKKMKTQSSSFDIHKAEWLRKHNPEHILQDDGYKKHLKHHCNK